MPACPSVDELASFLDLQNGAAGDEALAGHIDECPSCRRHLDRLTDYPEFRHSVWSAVPDNGEEPFSLKFPMPALASSAAGLPQLPGYEILEELGRGGMSVVWKARQISLNRLVALKMIQTGSQASAEAQQRFRREAETVARLQHPNIVQIHEIGEADGCPFLALEFVEGSNLKQLMAAETFSPRQSAELLKTLAEAVHFAHENGVVHRDMKPANILLMRNAECGMRNIEEDSEFQIPKAEFQIPKIADFGLAKLMEGDEDLTRSGRIMGTPAYMAPEQAQGESKFVGPAADIYSLGVILYELLAGRAPFRGESEWETMRQTVQADPSSLRSISRTIPSDLETICFKCLEKQPVKRYKSAQALATDLGRWLDGKPILAKPVSNAEKFARWSRRNPVIAGLAATVFLLLLSGLGFTSFFAVEADLQRRLAEDELQKNELLVYFQNIGLANGEWHRDNVARTLRLLDSCPSHLRGWEWNYLKRRCHSEWIASSDFIRVVAVHPNENLVAVGAGKHIFVWDVESRKTVKQFTHPEFVEDLSFNANGKLLLVSSLDGPIGAWDLARKALASELTELKSPVVRSFLGKNGGQFAVGSQGKSLFVWDLEHVESNVKHSAPTHLDRVRRLAVNQNRNMLAATARNHTQSEIILWSINGMKLEHLAKLSDSTRIYSSAAFHPKTKVLAASVVRLDNRLAQDGQIRFVDLSDVYHPRIMRTIHCNNNVHSVAFFNDGNHLAAGVGHTVQIFDTTDGTLYRTVRGHTADIRSVGVSADDKWIISADNDGAAKVWASDLEQEAQVLSFDNAKSINALDFSRDGLMAVASYTGKVHVCDLKIKGRNEIFAGLHKGPRRGAMDVALHPDGQQLATASQDQRVKIWNWKTKKQTQTIDHGDVLALCYSPSGDRLATADAKGFVNIWEIATARVLQKISAHKKAIRDINFSPDGNRLVTASRDSTAKIWAATSGKLLQTFSKHKKPTDVNAAVFNPNGDLVASAGDDHTARVWNAYTGDELTILRGHTLKVSGIAFTSDGKRLVTVSDDRTVRLWDVATGKEILMFTAHNAATSAVAFSKDGLLATGDWDGKVRIWNGTPLIKRRALGPPP